MARLHRWRFHAFVFVLVMWVVAACASPEPMPAEVTRVERPVGGEPTTTPARQVLPQISVGQEGAATTAPEPTAPAAPMPEEAAVGEQPLPGAQPTVWRPREVAARVQAALATMLDTEPQQVPWVDYVSNVNPAELTCLDQLVGDVPAFGEGEALVFTHKGVSIYVVSSQGQVWVCRTTEEGAVEGMTLEKARETAIADLAKRLGIDAAAINVVSAEEVTWSDASLGCPEPGKMYAQVLTPGYKIVLEAQGTRYTYHGSQEKVFLCEAQEE